MCPLSSRGLALVLCFVLNAVSLNSGATNAWTAVSSEKLSGTKSNRANDQLSYFPDADKFQVADDFGASAVGEEQPLLPGKSDKEKPLNNIGSGLFHNYRSSYVGDKTLRSPSRNHVGTMVDVGNKIDEVDSNEELQLRNRRRKPLSDFENEIKYNVGPGVNISVDKTKELVSVFLDEDCLKDVFTGRGRKNELITKILPLFILPFLIQSAVVPFLLSSLKLLLIKSILVGKIAIFLLLLSAFRNHVKYAYDAGPWNYSEPPSRRSEALHGYRVEGRPTTWVN